MASCGTGEDSPAAQGEVTPQSPQTTELADTTEGEQFAVADLVTPEGEPRGTVEFAEVEGGTLVTVEAVDLSPGFHGLHIHTTGLCEPDSGSPDGEKTGDFLSAGGHLTGDADAEGHGNPDGGAGHAGDLPSLLVGEDGTASMTFTTDRLTKDLLLDDDGSAVMVHSKADNYANVPERYAEDGPDADTLKAGDAGDRALCGVVEE